MPSIQKSIFPLEYNKNNPMEGFNDWSEYIRKEILDTFYSGSRQIISDRLDEEKQQNIISWEARKLLNQKP